MHFDATITFGNVVTFIAIIGGIWRVEQFLRHTDKLLQKFAIEHEILINDYCRRNNVSIHEFPTRMKGLF